MTNEDLNEKEKHWISLFKPKFNFTEGGDGVGSGENNPMYGKKRSEESKKKMSEAHKGKKQSEETRKKISEALSGENHYMYGTKCPEETRKKISKALSGENSPYWKDCARVVKAGFKNGKQNYALRHNGKTITTSIYKEKLEKKAEERNKKKDKQK